MRYPWLVYSKYLDSAFCLPCLCFGIEFGKNGSKLDKLFRSPLTFWTTAMAKFKQHSITYYVTKLSVVDQQHFELTIYLAYYYVTLLLVVDQQHFELSIYLAYYYVTFICCGSKAS